MPPKRRAPTPPDDLGTRHRAVLYGLSAAGFAGLLVAVAVVALGGSGLTPKAVAADFTAASCSFRTVAAYVPPGQGTHVASLTKKLPWNTSPPSNGQHYPKWAVWGFYTEPVNPRMVVHNEEHGGVVTWWGPQVPAGTVEALRQFYDEQPVASFGTPYPSLGGKVAITAWTGNHADYRQDGYYGQGHIAVCPRFTEKTKTAFEAFRKLYRGHGPEGIPLCADHPGNGPTRSSCG